MIQGDRARETYCAIYIYIYIYISREIDLGRELYTDRNNDIDRERSIESSGNLKIYRDIEREIETEHLPWCRQHGVSVMAYWVLLKGLLAGRLSRDHVFEPPDGRAKYPMFQGAEYQRNLDFVDLLRRIASDVELTVSQLVIAWTLAQPGISVALCGGRRPEQIRESAVAMGADLGEEVLDRVDQAIAARGDAASRPPI